MIVTYELRNECSSPGSGESLETDGSGTVGHISAAQTAEHGASNTEVMGSILRECVN